MSYPTYEPACVYEMSTRDGVIVYVGCTTVALRVLDQRPERPRFNEVLRRRTLSRRSAA